MQYECLRAPIRVGAHTYKNRMAAAPIYCGPFINIPGLSEIMVNAMKARALGGAAQVTVGETPVNFNGANKDPFEPIDYADYQSETFLKFCSLTDAIRAQGAIAMIEISHCGESREMVSGAQEAFGPMGYVREDGLKVVAMDEAHMEKTVEEFILAARYMREAGFHGVMVHAGHGWLLHQFLSARTNRRTDGYGGALENRARFPLTLLRRLREAMGASFLLELRVSGDECMENGMGIDETVEFCKWAEPYIDLIHVSVGVYRNPVLSGQFSSIYHPHGLNAGFASKVKAAVNVPVTVVGGISDPMLAEELIASGQCDLVAFGRQLTADAEFPKKVAEGKAEDIARCIRCYKCFPGLLEGVMHDLTKLFGCTVNPREFILDEAFLHRKPEASRRVLVVGGGIAGLQAAVTAHERGHRVTLAEASGSLGGLLRFTDQDSFKIDLFHFKELMIRRVRERGIEVLTDTRVTEENLSGFDADAVIIAVGSRPAVPAIEGIGNAVHATDAYGNENALGKNVVILGGGLVGAEAGLHLAAKGHNVTLLEMRDQIAPDAYPMHRIAMMHELERRLTYKTGLTCTKVEKNLVTAVDENGGTSVLEADTVLYALGMRANRGEAEALMAAAGDRAVYLVGDCTSPAKVYDACRQAFLAAYSIL